MGWKATRQSVGLSWETGTGVEVSALADRIRPTQTGAHARISVLVDGRTVAYDSFNVEREKERIHLINSSFTKLPKGEVDKARFGLFVHSFCLEFWGQWSSQFDAEEIVGDPDAPPVPFVLHPYSLEGGGTILFAPPGQGKSWIALLMAQSTNCGVSTFWETSKRKVLFVNLERSKDSIRRRLVLVNQQLYLEPTEPLLIMNARGRSLVDVVERIQRAVDAGAEVVWLDSISRSGYGSLKDDDTANRIMDELNGVAPTWNAVGHSPRQDASHVFGSQMFDAAADMAVQVMSQKIQDGRLGVGLKVTKANDIAFPPLAIWALEFDAFGLSGFRRGKSGEFPEIEGQEHQDPEGTLYDYLLAVGQSNLTDASSELGIPRTTLVDVTKRSSRFVRTRDGKAILYSIGSDRT